MTQEEFGRLAYEFMECVFAVHNEMGRFFSEDIYRDALARRFPNVQTEVRIEVRLEDFVKEYFIDLLISGGAVFELKTARALNASHRSQLLNYLLLAELSHGKLVNLGPDLVEHEFVNTSLTLADRVRFDVDDRRWRETGLCGEPLASSVVRMLRELGTGLDLHLYEDFVAYVLGGEERVVQPIEILDDTGSLGTQKVRLAAPGWGFKITAIDSGGQPRFEGHARRFVRHTRLEGMQWINITRGRLTLTTIER